MELMLRIYFVQHWFTLSDPAMEDEIYESTSVRRFLKLDPLTDSVPDESTILRFRHLLEAHALAGKLFESVNADLVDKGLLLRGGSIVETTLIAAPSSTKNQERKRDPEMSSTKKGNDWHFGMKLHIAVDVHSGLAHTAGATRAKVHDAAVFGDKGYVNNKLKKSARQHGVYWISLARSARSEPRRSNITKSWPPFGPKLNIRFESLSNSSVIERRVIEAFIKMDNSSSPCCSARTCIWRDESSWICRFSVP